MRKFLYCIIFVFLTSLSTLIFGCSVPTYSVDYGLFDSVVEYNSSLSYLDKGLSIVKIQGSEKEIIEITQDMVTYCDDTSSVGQKKIVVLHEGKSYIINFTVKYRVDFAVDGNIINTQYVFDNSELELPDAPTMPGCEFVGWSPVVSTAITNNTVYNANFTVSQSGIPLLLTCSATYGDRLRDVNLPKNSNGEWQFLKDLSTSVGNAGEQTFDVKFVPYDSDLITAKFDKVKVKVNKKLVNFENVTQSFVYDGSVKTPDYTISDEVDVEYIPYYQGQAVNKGSYEFELEVKNPNYKGSYYGVFEIKPINTVVDIADINIKFTDSYPQRFVYSIVDEKGKALSKNLIDLMGLKIIKPNYQHAGIYEITAQVENPNFNATINKGYLTVQKVEHDLQDSTPTFVGGASIVYGNYLSNLMFENNDVRGKWSWKTPNIKILTPNTFKAIAIFTPKEDKDYLVSEKEIEIDVRKKHITIEVNKNHYVYDATQHTVEYTVCGVETEDLGTVVITGNQQKTTAGTYTVCLAVNSDDYRYIGSIDTSLIIEKASISNFDITYTETWTPSLLLQDIKLNNGYQWVYPSTPITEVGNQNHLVRFTPEDTVNYKTEVENIFINILKAQAQISTQDQYLFEYNTKVHRLQQIVATHTETDIEYNYLLNGTPVDEILNAGQYQVELTLPESKHYKEAKITIDVVVEKAENREIVQTTQNAVYGDFINKYTFETSKTGIWTWQGANQNTTVGNAGQNKFIAVFTPFDTANYKSRQEIVTFNVAKCLVELPTINNLKYEKFDQNSGIKETSLYTVVDEGGSEIKTYYVYLTLKDAKNYRWPGSFENNSTATLEYKIEKNINNSWQTSPTITKNSWFYIDEYNKDNEEAGKIIAESKFGDYIVAYKLKNSNQDYKIGMPVDAGKYIAKVYVEEQDEYNGLVIDNIEFEIKPIIVIAPKDIEIDYTGVEQTSGIKQDNRYSISNDNEVKDVDVYHILVELLNDNYVWSDGYQAKQRTINFTINQAENSWSITPFVESSYQFTFTDAFKPVAQPQFGALQTSYYKVNTDGTLLELENFPHDVGDYKVEFSVAGNNNYTGMEKTLDFTISPAQLEYIAPQFNSSQIYYENTVDITSAWLNNGYSATFEGRQIDGEFEYISPILSTSSILTKTETIEGLTYTRHYAQVSFNTTFKAANFVDSVDNAVINLYAVCRDNNNKYFGTIENALDATASGTVTVMPYPMDGVVILRDAQIQSKTSLVLPYLNASNAEEVNTEGKAKLESKAAPGFSRLKLTNKILIAENVVLTNSGTILVAGETSGGGATYTAIAGNTAGNYAKIVMASGAKITNSGTINLFGYIDELTPDNNSEIVAHSGTVYMPFIIHDYRGGNYMMSAKNNGVSAFNQFELRNILPQLTLYDDAKLIGHGNLYAKLIQAENNYSPVYLAGNGSDGNSCIIKLKDNAYMIAKYRPINRVNDDDKWQDGVNYISLYGGADTQTLSLTVMGTNVSTEGLDFPLSFRQNVTLVTGTYTMNQYFKMLPGHVFTVNEGVNLTINRLNIYQSYTDNVGLSAGLPNYPQLDPTDNTKSISPAVFNMYGNLTVTTIGGNVNVNDKSNINVTNSKATTYEVEKVTEKSFYIPLLQDKYNVTKQTFAYDLYLKYVVNGELKSQQITTSGLYKFNQTNLNFAV
ncbi:MAG: hypothetical protein IJD48_02000 [Clostridia bacterium]|nr:hypothetical protein [Clostridia bacterium]